MEIVTGEGQLKVGDKLTIIGKATRNCQQTTVKEVIDIDGNEEIIINKKFNYYFITHLLISGKSWAKQVQITN